MKAFVRLALGNLAVLAALVLVVVVAAEAWLRLRITPSSGDSIFEYTLETKRYKRMRSSATAMPWGVPLATNQLGFRDEAVAPKAPDEYRIAVLGDSFTVSAGVPFADIYTTLLQRGLRREFPRVRVLNLAVGGYNLVQYELVLREVALGLEPDLLLLALFPENDFSNKTYEENRRVAMGEAPPPRKAWYEHSLAWRVYNARIARRALALIGGEPAGSSASGAQHEWDQNAAALEAIARAARGRGVPLQVVLLPHTVGFDAQRRQLDRVAALCRKLEIECLDLLDEFVAAGLRGGADLRLNAIDAHPNARYNAAVADILLARLRSRLGELQRNSPVGQGGVGAWRTGRTAKLGDP